MLDYQNLPNLDSLEKTCEYLRGRKLITDEGIAQVYKDLGFPTVLSDPT